MPPETLSVRLGEIRLAMERISSSSTIARVARLEGCWDCTRRGHSVVAVKFVYKPALTGSVSLFYSTDEGRRASARAQQGVILSKRTIKGYRPCGENLSCTADQLRKMVNIPVVNDNIIKADGALCLSLINRSGTVFPVRNGTGFALH